MSDTTYLQLPYLAASQAQKHVTHNEALSLIDSLVHLAVKSRALAAPPATPSEADRYLVAAAPTGLWLGRANQIAVHLAGAWRFLTPREGWRMWVDDENLFLAFDGTTWISSTVPTSLQNMQSIGINATADTTNKLSVNSSAILFNNAGAGTQVKVNKNAATDSASFLFQTGFSGRAEIGTTGDDNFHFKVSADGIVFSESFVLDALTGRADFKNSLAMTPQAADPVAPSDGQIWYNSTAGKFRGQQAGLNIDLDGTTASLGEAALSLIPSALRSKKFAIADFVGAGFASRDFDNNTMQGRLEPSLNLSNATGGTSITAKKKILVNAANRLRHSHGADGSPLGAIIESGAAYLNRYSQPNVSQLVASSNVTNGVAPSGWGSSAIAFGDNTANRSATFFGADVVSSTSYWNAYLVRMADGSAPVVGAAGDFSLSLFSNNSPLNPDTGAAGVRLTALADQVYLIDAYITTGAGSFVNQLNAIQKVVTHSVKGFSVLGCWGGVGRYRPSLFPNATATPNTRAPDNIAIPLSGFALDNVTLAAEFVMPRGQIQAYILQAFADANNRLSAVVVSDTTISVSAIINGNAQSINITSLVAGNEYRLALAFDSANGKFRAKATGIAAPAEGTQISISSAIPTLLHVGANGSTQHLNSGLKAAAIIDRAWTASEISKWVEA